MTVWCTVLMFSTPKSSVHSCVRTHVLSWVKFCISAVALMQICSLGKVLKARLKSSYNYDYTCKALVVTHIASKQISISQSQREKPMTKVNRLPLPPTSLMRFAHGKSTCLVVWCLSDKTGPNQNTGTVTTNGARKGAVFCLNINQMQCLKVPQQVK